MLHVFCPPSPPYCAWWPCPPLLQSPAAGHLTAPGTALLQDLQADWLQYLHATSLPQFHFATSAFSTFFYYYYDFLGPPYFLWLYLIPIYFSICFLSCSFPYSAWHYRAIVELLIWDACEYPLKTINLHLALCQYVIIIYKELAWQNSKIPVTTLSQILENNS